jgi:glycosyltransferase involved in cell wall biosynthesis
MKRIAVLEWQAKEFSFPLKRAYDAGVSFSKKTYFKSVVLPAVKGMDTTVYALDFATESAFKAAGVHVLPLRDVTENLWEYGKGRRAMDLIKTLEKLMAKHGNFQSYEGINLIEMTRKDIWRSYFVPIVAAVDAYETILKGVDEVVIFNKTSIYQSILEKMARKKGIRVVDKTVLTQKAGFAIKNLLVRSLASYNIPPYIRKPRAAEPASKGLLKRYPLLICHNTVQPKKTIPWAKYLKQQAIYVGVHQDGTLFGKEGIPFVRLADFIDAPLARKLKSLQREIARSAVRAGSLHLTYKGVPIDRELDELFAFFYRARFYETVADIELFKAMLKVVQPKVIATLDDMSVFGRTLTEVGAKRKIPTFIIQPGYFAQSSILDSTAATKMLVYGDATKENLMKSGIPAKRIDVVGLAEDEAPAASGAEVYAHFKISKGKKIFLFTSQAIPEGQNRPLFDAVYGMMRRFPDVQFFTKLHPAENALLHEEFIKRHAVKNVILIRHGVYPLDKLLSACTCLVNFYSTVGIEAMSLGKYVISVNVTGIPDFLLPKDVPGIVMTAHNKDELMQCMKVIVAKKKPETERIREVSKHYVAARGDAACRTVAARIKRELGGKTVRENAPGGRT